MLLKKKRFKTIIKKWKITKPHILWDFLFVKGLLDLDIN